MQNFIDGKFAAPLEGKLSEKLSPRTGLKLYDLPDSTEVDVAVAVRAAHKAFKSWSESKERASILLKIADAIDAHAEELARADTDDLGLPLHFSKTANVARASQNFRFYANFKSELSPHVVRQPVGVCALITPWNLPLYFMTSKLAPALVSGNTVVCKPSELGSKSCFVLARLMAEAGLPDGVCNFVFGRGEPVGSYLVKHPGVPLVSFTGATATGEKIQTMAAPFIKKLSLELSGKNSALVMNDVDLAEVIPQIARSCFLNSGQSCASTSRILVQEGIAKEFTAAFVEHVAGLKVGDPLLEETFMGPLISEAQRERVLKSVALAKSENGKILLGGEAPKLANELTGGYYLQPTVVDDLTNCSEIHQTEVLGPFTTINTFKYPFDGVKQANTTPYGLSASVWTKNLESARKVVLGLDAGTVWINTWLKRDLSLPYGGSKTSGLGRSGGEYSLDFYAQTKAIIFDSTLK